MLPPLVTPIVDAKNDDGSEALEACEIDEAVVLAGAD